MESALSERIQRLAESNTIKMTKMARELRATGRDVISLSLGEPDFDTPEYIKAGAKEGIDKNFSHYSPIPGYKDLLEAICGKLKNQNGLDYDPTQIIVSTGAKQSLANLFLCLVNHGDEVVIPTPYWVTYPELANLAGGTSVFIETNLDNQFKITPQQLEDSLTNKAKLFVFSSPSNPTGSIYSKEEIRALTKVFEKYPHVYIASDEIYEHINFVGETYSIASEPSLKDRVIYINGFSKSYAMTGWRLGYMAAPAFIAKAVNKLQGQLTSGTCSIAQRAAVTAYNGGMKEIHFMKDQFLKRRNLVYGLLNEIDGLKTNLPDGAFYFFPDVGSFFGKSNGGVTIHNSMDLSLYLLEEAGVATVAGSAFGSEGYIRLSYATSEEILRKAIQKIKSALDKLH